MWLINTTATAPTAVAISGFARPVNAFFSSDSNTAYVLNCGPECGSTAGPPSVMSFDIASQTIKSTVAVGGASVGLLKGSNLYVAGYPGGSTGTFDVVDVSNMTRTTTNSVAIGDGTHTTMALSNNNKLYIGAATCVNVTTGCLSIVDLGTNQAAPPTAPFGAVTGMQSIPNRNTMYVIEGGVLYIYDTTTGQLQSTQISFRGALYGVVQVDPVVRESGWNGMRAANSAARRVLWRGSGSVPSLRLEREMVLRRLLHRVGRERQLEGAAMVVRVPLIVVVLVENIARLSIDDVQRRVVEVRHIGGEALGRAELRARPASRSGHRRTADAGPGRRPA